MVQYCVSDFSGSPSHEESQIDMPCDRLNAMCYGTSIGAWSAKSNVLKVMANDDPNREPRIAPPSQSVLWNASVLPWEWRKKHQLMASYSGKGLLLVLVQVQVIAPVPVEVEEPCERLHVPSPSSLLCGEVSGVVRIVLKSCPTVSPSSIPTSSPSQVQGRVLYLWQRDVPHHKENQYHSSKPSYFPIGGLSIVPEEEYFEVSGSSASNL